MTNQLFVIRTHAPRGFTQPHTLTGLPPETPLLVAFSGGADSRLLLHLAVCYREIYGTPVYAAHLNHAIRGEEADRDEAFCRLVTKAADVPFFSEQVDVPALAMATSESLELAARQARYKFLSRIMREQKIPLLLTAHHADDQLETLLLRLLRGTGTRGMGGIPPVRPLPDVPNGHILRPLLGCTKADILDACRELGLTYVTDSTNELDNCTRNRIRHEILLVLEKIAGEGVPSAAANRLARAAREDDEYLTQTAAAHTARILSPEGTIPLDELNALHPAVARRIILQAYAQQVPDPTGDRSLQAVHLDNLLSLCAKGVHGSTVALPGRMEGRICDARLVFVDSRKTPTAIDTTNEPIPLSIGVNPWDRGRLIIELRMVSSPVTLSDNNSVGDGVIAWASFPADLPLPLHARRRRAGDVIRRHGVRCKLKKLLCDKGIPASLRDRLPLICLDGGQTPLWYPNAGFADGYPAPTRGSSLLVIVREADKA